MTRPNCSKKNQILILVDVFSNIITVISNYSWTLLRRNWCFFCGVAVFCIFGWGCCGVAFSPLFCQICMSPLWVPVFNPFQRQLGGAHELNQVAVKQSGANENKVVLFGRLWCFPLSSSVWVAVFSPISVFGWRCFSLLFQCFRRSLLLGGVFSPPPVLSCLSPIRVVLEVVLPLNFHC